MTPTPINWTYWASLGPHTVSNLTIAPQKYRVLVPFRFGKTASS